MSIEFVSRFEWGARPYKSIQYINRTVSYVIIHHSDLPAVCPNKQECSRAMRSMQRYHQIERGWADIGYTSVTDTNI